MYAWCPSNWGLYPGGGGPAWYWSGGGPGWYYGAYIGMLPPGGGKFPGGG